MQCDGSVVFDRGKTPTERRNAARKWLQEEQRRHLPELRSANLATSRFEKDVTLVTYTFPQDESDFDFIEFAIRQSWNCLGLLKTVVVADRMTQTLNRFKASAGHWVEIQIEPSLKIGNIASMSSDCIERLHTRFSTPYCLIIQDDGFPLRDNLNDFLGKYDYMGSPVIRDLPVQYIVDLLRCECLNGGFSLRSRRICRDAARQWRFWRHFIKPGSHAHAEDVFYTKPACFNPLYRLRNRFPSSKTARLFSLPDFDGVVDIRNITPEPFGIHGPCAAYQLMERQRK